MVGLVDVGVLVADNYWLLICVDMHAYDMYSVLYRSFPLIRVAAN